jgi:predicted alpha/beta-hydrolase family hydrolase
LPETSIRAFVDDTVDPHVRGFLHLPANPNGSGLVLTHGAGSNAQAPLLIALAETFSAAGFAVLRCNLPYRQARSYGPPGPGVAARDRAGLKNALVAVKQIVTDIGGAPGLAAFARPGNSEVPPPLSRPMQQGGGSGKTEAAPSNAPFVGWESTLARDRAHEREGHEFTRAANRAKSARALAPEVNEAASNPVFAGPALSAHNKPNGWDGKLFLSGHSYGGRQSSMLCAEHPGLVAGLLLLSYPLHPPRKPEQQRTQHLPNLRTPALFVHGTRDPFGSIPEIERALKMIPAKTKLLPVEGAGHDLGFKGKAKREGLPKEILAEFERFLA